MGPCLGRAGKFAPSRPDLQETLVPNRGRWSRQVVKTGGQEKMGGVEKRFRSGKRVLNFFILVTNDFTLSTLFPLRLLTYYT